MAGVDDNNGVVSNEVDLLAQLCCNTSNKAYIIQNTAEYLKQQSS